MSNQVNSTAQSRVSLRLTAPALAALALAAVAALALGACTSPAKQQRKDDAAAINTRLGIEYMRRGDLALAKEKLDKAVGQDPESADVHAARAELFKRMGQKDDADSEFRRALSLAPRDPAIENSYAAFLCSHGRTDEGVKRFLEAAGNPLYKTPEVAYSNAGVCLRVAKRNDEAALNFNRALQINPNYSEAAFQLATLQFERGQLPAARSQIDGYLASHDATPDLLLLGVRVARAQGDRVGAVGYARRLQRDFAGSDQARALAALDHNPG
jgi:type IV pilus assembly protein PilF